MDEVKNTQQGEIDTPISPASHGRAEHCVIVLANIREWCAHARDVESMESQLWLFRKSLIEPCHITVFTCLTLSHPQTGIAALGLIPILIIASTIKKDTDLHGCFAVLGFSKALRKKGKNVRCRTFGMSLEYFTHSSRSMTVG
ncbi:hypothetical protein [Pseudomonas sp. R5(2019)]|uniref:hypothetical protein n=1 Tax=Pseudomonas sp. R5(2019) TaxID=2697566 RepID=UPI00353219B6